MILQNGGSSSTPSRSLKAVLLFNGNKIVSVPVGHSVQMTENYSNMEHLLTALKYKDHNWMICGDLKVVSMVLGLQGGYTKYPCFLCLWDSRADKQHYVQRNWPERSCLEPGYHNVVTRSCESPEDSTSATAHQARTYEEFCQSTEQRRSSFRFPEQEISSPPSPAPAFSLSISHLQLILTKSTQMAPQRKFMSGAQGRKKRKLEIVNRTQDKGALLKYFGATSAAPGPSTSSADMTVAEGTSSDSETSGASTPSSDVTASAAEVVTEIIHETKMADTSPFTVEERLVAVVWCHERRNTNKTMKQMQMMKTG
uniref:uncharacterized protein isoform X2 n=1 Tax=Myxine glutinosa TaxID=7769 RepID=UPI003590302A